MVLEELIQKQLFAYDDQSDADAYQGRCNL